MGWRTKMKPEQLVVDGGVHAWCSSALFSGVQVRWVSLLQVASSQGSGMRAAVAMSWKLLSGQWSPLLLLAWGGCPRQSLDPSKHSTVRCRNVQYWTGDTESQPWLSISNLSAASRLQDI